MSSFNYKKYPKFPAISMQDRQWPNRIIDRAPVWCSVDLRDGNQALIEPMTVDQKKQMFQLLVDMGFKEIEVGFPAASQPDYDFLRELIDNGMIPDDVTIQVLTQAREHLIERTYESLKGAKRAIVHLYNSTSTIQREKVFRLDRQGIIDIAIQGAKWVQDYAKQNPDTDWTFQYSPESFTGTEMDFAVEVCDAVIDVWKPTPERPVIVNLPATVEMSTPNIYADQVEWFCNHIARRNSLIVSVHTHNDRGCAVAAAELALMAGANRVEGTLLGNGERTGNVDIVTMALNLYTRGIDPELDISDVDRIISCYKECNQLPVHPRHPYVGELVFTAFSGSHQDAIRKCLSDNEEGDVWDIAYLPIDPRDLGRNYQEVIRINSQSGKGGVAYILEQEYDIQMPRPMQIDFSGVVQKIAEDEESELSPEQIWNAFQSTYMSADTPYELAGYSLAQDGDNDGHYTIEAALNVNGTVCDIKGGGRGPLAAFVDALAPVVNQSVEIVDFSEHSLSKGTDAKAAAYLQVKINGKQVFGVGLDRDILRASFVGVLRALNNEAR